MTNELKFRVRIEQIEMGFFRASSRDLPGLFSANKDYDALVRTLPRAIAELLEAKGQTVSIEPGEKLDESTLLFRAQRTAFRRAC